MGVNSLPKTVARQRRGCDLNPDPTAPESSTLTTRLPSHPMATYIETKVNESLFSLLRRLSTWHCPHLLLSAGACCTAPAVVIDIYLPAGRSAANPPATVAAVDRWERWTNYKITKLHLFIQKISVVGRNNAKKSLAGYFFLLYPVHTVILQKLHKLELKLKCKSKNLRSLLQ